MAKFIISEIENSSLYERTLHVSNPCHDQDVFTDRWPESVNQQNEYSGKLKQLVSGLETIQAGKMVPTDMMEWLREQFGDRVVTRSADRIADLVGASVKDSSQQYAPKGRLILPTPAILAAPAAAIVTPSVASGRDHTFFGKKI